MSDSVVIHVGYHKSASTFLQQIFGLAPVNYFFPSRETLDYMQSPEFDAADFRARFEKKSGNRSVSVISHEELSGHPHGHDSVDPYLVARNMQSLYPDAQVLFTVRNQFRYIRSIYSYRVGVKGEDWRSYSRFVREEGEAGLYEKLEYDGLVSYYHELFGPDNVTVLPMEFLKTDSGKFFDRVAALLNLSTEQLQLPQERVNRSFYDPRLLALWRTSNYLFYAFRKALVRMGLLGKREKVVRYKYYHTKRAISAYLMSEESVGCRICLGEVLQNELRPRFARSNTRLGELIGEDLGELGYPVLDGPEQVD